MPTLITLFNYPKTRLDVCTKHLPGKQSTENGIITNDSDDDDLCVFLPQTVRSPPTVERTKWWVANEHTEQE